MPTLKINDLDVYYETHGEGEPIIFVGGITQNLLPWTLYQVPYFSEKGYKCILLDNRGIGRTSTGQIDNYSIQDLAKDTIGLLDALDVDSVNFVGFSMGGMVGLEMAIQIPKRLRSLTLLGSAAKISAYDESKMTYLLSAKKQLDNESFWRLMVDKVMTWRVFENQEAIDRLFGFVTSEANHQSADSMQRQVEAFKNFDSVSALPSIDVPTHVIVGQEDIMVAPRHSEYLQSNMPNAKLSTIEKAGHSAYSEKSEVFNALVSGFIEHLPK